MSSEFKPLLEFQNVSNQVFALELTIDGLDKEIDNLDMRAAGCASNPMRVLIRLTAPHAQFHAIGLKTLTSAQALC